MFLVVITSVAHPAGFTCGAYEQLFGTGGREFDRQKLKNSNVRWGCPGKGGGGGVGVKN